MKTYTQDDTLINNYFSIEISKIEDFSQYNKLFLFEISTIPIISSKNMVFLSNVSIIKKNYLTSRFQKEIIDARGQLNSFPPTLTKLNSRILCENTRYKSVARH